MRFGAFEVDLEGRRLLKRGVPVTLREQSFQVLAALMERPGEIVTREELRRRLWSSDTFVDFEVALNSAVSRLRDALGDSANSASYFASKAGVAMQDKSAANWGLKRCWKGQYGGQETTSASALTSSV